MRWMKMDRETASMGIAVGDYRNNGLLDLYNTVFSDDTIRSNRNEGDANFGRCQLPVGLGEVTIPFLAWGTGFLDYDNDDGRTCSSPTVTFIPK